MEDFKRNNRFRPKHVNIYETGTPTAKAQEKTGAVYGRAMDAVTNTAKTLTSGIVAPVKNAVQGASAIGNRFVAPVAQAAVKPIVDAHKKNQRFMTQQKTKVVGNAANREADALLYGSGEKQVGGTGTFSPKEARKGLGVKQAQSFTPQAMQRDGIQSQRIDPATASSFRRAVTPPVSPYTEAANEAMAPTRTVYTNSGNNITAEQQPMRLGNPAAMNRLAPGDTPATTRPQVGNRSRLSMNQKAGNLDIQFDPGTDEQSIRRFMENPVRPTAQIDRFNARQGMGSGQGQRAAMSADRVLGLNQNVRAEGQMFTKENSPNMGWKTMARLNEQLLANKQSETNARIQADSSRDSNVNQFNIAKMGASVNADRNNIDRMKAESDNAVNSAAVAGSQFDLGRKEFVDSIQRKYATAPEGPEREALGRQLTGLGEPVDPGKSYELEQGKLRAQERKTAVEADKSIMQGIDKMDGGDERRSALISLYDPSAPTSQVQKRVKAAIREEGRIIAEDFEQKDGMFNNPLPELLEKYFPPGTNPDVAMEILENIPDKKLRMSLGRALGQRELNTP